MRRSSGGRGGRRGRWIAAAALAGVAPLVVTACDRPAGEASRAGEGTAIDASLKLNAYDVSLLGLDLRDSRKVYQGQDIAHAKADGEFFVDPQRLGSWVEELDRAIAMDGTLPTVDPAARRFAAALRPLATRLRSLDSYYRMRGELADGLARGRREDPLVLADYDRALAALAPFRDAVTAAANTADAALLGRLRAEGNLVDYYDVEIARRARLLRGIADAPGLADDGAAMARAAAIVGEVTGLLDKARTVRAEAARRAAGAPKPESAVDDGAAIRLDDNVINATESMVGAFNTYQRADGDPDRDRGREQERFAAAATGVILATR